MGSNQRFRVTSLTGYRIDPSLAGNANGRAYTQWYVIDSVYCHRVVQTCRTEHMARRVCRELNLRERRGEFLEPEVNR